MRDVLDLMGKRRVHYLSPPAPCWRMLNAEADQAAAAAAPPAAAAEAAPPHDTRKSAASAAGAAASSAKGPTPSTKAARGFVFFSDRLRAATGDALTIAFTPAVLAAIRTELEKVHAARQLAWERIYPPEIRTHLDSEAYRRLRQPHRARTPD